LAVVAVSLSIIARKTQFVKRKNFVFYNEKFFVATKFKLCLFQRKIGIFSFPTLAAPKKKLCFRPNSSFAWKFLQKEYCYLEKYVI